MPHVEERDFKIFMHIFIWISISEKATKDCGADGQWYEHPQSNRGWSNYTLCAVKVMTRGGEVIFVGFRKVIFFIR